MIRTSSPSEGVVHIHTIHLPLHQEGAPWRGDYFLSPAETGRADQLKNDLIKTRYMAGRSALRKILGAYLGVEPEKVSLDNGLHGKPFVTDSITDIRFNLSHSGALMLLAVAAGTEVGIDLETADVHKPLQAIAQISFSPRERSELLAMESPELMAAAFYRCWVRKEACLKACGSGFTIPGSSFDLSGQPVQMVRCDGRPWHVLDIDVPCGFCAALAFESRSPAEPPPKILMVASEGLPHPQTN